MSQKLRITIIAAIALSLALAFPGASFADEPEGSQPDLSAAVEAAETDAVSAGDEAGNPDGESEEPLDEASEASGVADGSLEGAEDGENPANADGGDAEEVAAVTENGQDSATDEIPVMDAADDSDGSAESPSEPTAAEEAAATPVVTAAAVAEKPAATESQAAGSTTTPKSTAPAPAVKAAATSTATAYDQKTNPAYDAGFRNGHQYVLAPGHVSNRALTSAGSEVSSNTLSRTVSQLWKCVFTEDGFVSFISVSNGKALGVAGGKGASGTKVGLYTASNSLAQKWTVQKSGSSYAIISALSTSKLKLALDVASADTASGAGVQVYKANGTKAQSWSAADASVKRAALDKKAKATAMPAGTYAIASGVGSVQSMAVSGNNVQNASYSAAATQKWTIVVGKDGYATVKASDGRVLDVAGGKGVAGTNVGVYKANGSRAQKWIVTKNSNGSYLLESALWPGLVVDVAGASAKAGANIQLYSKNGTKAQSWDVKALKPAVAASDTVAEGWYVIWAKKKGSVCLDISGAAASAGANVQLYAGNASLAQRFRIVKSGKYYRLEPACAPGQGVSIAGKRVVPGTASKTAAGRLVSFKKQSSGTYLITDVSSGLTLGTAGGKVTKGTAVQGRDAVLGGRVGFVLEKKHGAIDGATYELQTTLSGGRAVTVVNASWDSGTTLDMESYEKLLSQKWRAKAVSGVTNTYTFENLTSGLRLTGATNDRASQNSANTTLQRWTVKPMGGNSVSLINVKTGKALDVSGANTAQGTAVMNWDANGTAAQKWNLKKVNDVDSGYYEFRLAANTGLSLDADCNSDNVHSWEGNRSGYQMWLYNASTGTLTNMTDGKALDVSGGVASSGTNVQRYAANGTNAQKWKITYDAAGRFKLTSSLGTTLVLTSAGSSLDSNVNISTEKKTTQQRWKMVETRRVDPVGFNLIKSIVSNGHGSLNPSYIVIHETANPGATAKNHRDYWSNDDTYAVHYTVDWTGNCYYCVPENRKCWQVGNGNAYVVGIELCHATNKSDFNKVWNYGVEWARWQLAKRGWGVDRLISHWDCTKRWGGSDHTDPDDYFEAYGKSWKQFKNDVAKALARGY